MSAFNNSRHERIMLPRSRLTFILFSYRVSLEITTSPKIRVALNANHYVFNRKLKLLIVIPRLLW